MNLPATSAFISLDGLDGSGKSTQARLLADHLTKIGLNVTYCVDPGGTELGAKIRELLLFGRQNLMSMRAEALLFMASRAELVTQVISPALARGEVVISDRYLLANIVYQGHAGGLDPEELWQLGRFCTQGMEPDLTLILDVPVDVAKTRRGQQPDRMESREDRYYHRVRDGFLFEARQRPDRVQVLDALLPLAQVQEQVQAVAKEFLRSRNILAG